MANQDRDEPMEAGVASVTPVASVLKSSPTPEAAMFLDIGFAERL